MTKGGLFLCSIGLLIILYSANQNTGQYNVLNMVTGVAFLISGGIAYSTGAKKEKALKNKNDKKK